MVGVGEDLRICLSSDFCCSGKKESRCLLVITLSLCFAFVIGFLFQFSIYLDLKCFIYACMGLIQGGQTIFVPVVFELGGMNAPRQFDCGFYSL